MKSINIGNHKIGADYPAYIIAEVSCNHRQDFSIAEKTVRAIAESGADAVKLQTCTPEGLTLDCDRDEFVIRGGTPWDGRTLFDLYCETQTPWEWHRPLKELAESLGLDFFSSPFDESAVDLLSELDVPAYKIASFEAVDIRLIELAAEKGKPIIISTGIASETDIDDAIAACHRVGNTQILLTKCTSAYPAPLSAANLLQIPTMSERFGCLVGLSDHTEGALAAIGAVAVGACLIEKHFILDRKLGGPDAEFSMEPAEFADMVNQVRAMEEALGHPTLEMSGEISTKGKFFARSLFVVEDIDAGTILTRSNLRSIRPGHGLAPKHLDSLLGRRVKTAVSRGTPMDWNLLE